MEMEDRLFRRWYSSRDEIESAVRTALREKYHMENGEEFGEIQLGMLISDIACERLNPQRCRTLREAQETRKANAPKAGFFY